VRLKARDGNALNALIYRATDFDPLKGPIWFVMHGASRAAERYIRTAAPVAEQNGALAIVIHFSKDAYPRHSDYTFGVTTVGRADRRALGEGRWRQPADYLFAELDRVFAAVRKTLGGRQPGYYMFGHSAGAQFTHRLLTFRPASRVLRAVAANAGWYTLPLAGGRRATMVPYGLSRTPVTARQVRALLRSRLTILVGERDTKTPATDRLLRGTRQANAQGMTRVQRGRFYFKSGRAVAKANGVEFGWRFAVVPRARHDAAQMMSSAAFFLFSTEASRCRPSSAAEARAVVITEILAHPPRASYGDANADGVRSASDDEFVELVNDGQTAVCLTGWSLGDARDPRRHVFPLGSSLEPGRALVVFGGGVPTGRFGGAKVQWAAFGGRLGLSKNGDVLTLRDAEGVTAAQISWGDCAGRRCASEHLARSLGGGTSFVRMPGQRRSWVAHKEVAAARFSPGTRPNAPDWRRGD
jgi:hypothetical protein